MSAVCSVDGCGRDSRCPLTCPVDTCSGWCDGEARHRGQHWCCDCDAEWD